MAWDIGPLAVGKANIERVLLVDGWYDVEVGTFARRAHGEGFTFCRRHNVYGEIPRWVSGPMSSVLAVQHQEQTE